MRFRLGWAAFVGVSLLVGALFRFAWVGDVEYKDDEDQLFQYSQAIPATHLWPAIGTTGGTREIRHPALGIWSFAILAGTFHLHTPLSVTQSVQGLSWLALVLLFWFAWRVVPIPQREVWLWTAALTSVNLVAVVYARKIWIPSLLPIFCVVLLIAWWYRHTSIGALVWGIDGALMGQAHMTGFFYAAAVLVGTALFARTNVRWRAWFAGSAWGAIPIIPWLHYMLVNQPAPPTQTAMLPHAWLSLDFFRMAFEISLSQTAEFNIGGGFQDYLAYPVLLGVPTEGVRFARTCLYGIGTIALVGAVAATVMRLRGWAQARRFSNTDLCLLSVVLTGVLCSAVGVSNLPHHHLMVFPLELLWMPVVVVACLPKPRIWLAAVWLGSVVCTFGFLQFIHDHCGAPNGEYGVAYRCQQNEHGSRSPELQIQPLIRSGQEDVIARMLGRGERLPGSCRLAEGQIDHGLVRATYDCDPGRIVLQLLHPSKAPPSALRTAQLAVVLIDGSPPAGFMAAITDHVRRGESSFAWLLEAGVQTSRVQDAPESQPYGYYLPVLTSRQVLMRLVGGTVILLLLWPWWGRPSVATGMRRS